MRYDGLRDWLVQVDAMNELRTLEGVDWNLEMSAVDDATLRNPHEKSLIFFGFWPSNSLALVAPLGRIAPRRRSNLSWLRPLLHARQARASFRPACYTFL